MKTAEEIKPNYGPVYCASMYPKLCTIFQKHGYALAVHGSLARDFDVIAVPWIDLPSDRETIFKEIESTYAIKVMRDFVKREHGREAYTVVICFGECMIDLSFMPIRKKRKK